MDPLQGDDPTEIGRYRILRRLGSGGMGQVYLGRSPGGRAVAVKLIRREYAERGDFRKRFAREIEAAQRVGGHYTAQVVDAQPNARPLPWMATTYIAGPSLREAVARFGRLPADVVQSLAAALAEGLEAIHARGLVHRDLKPENVILAADGPRIIDFGIARTLGDSVMTAHGAVMGTYAFMAPEQASGQVAGPPADIFSLAAVLLFAATGREPFGSAPAFARGPADLSVLPDGLRELLARCLAHDPAGRPGASEILTALARRTGEYRPPRPVLDMINFSQAEVAAALSAPPWMSGGPDRSLRRRTTAPGTRRRTLLIAGLGVAVPAVAGTATVLIKQLEHPPPKKRTSPPPDRNVLTGHAGPVNSMAFAADGATLATASDDGTVRLWSLATRRTTAVLTGHTGAVKAVAVSPNQRTLATGGRDGTVRLWDLTTGRTTRVLTGHTGAVNGLAFAPDGGVLASGGTDQSTRMWSMATLGAIATLKDRRAVVNAVVFGPDGTVLISAYADGKMRFWITGTQQKAGLLSVDGATSINAMSLTFEGRLAYGESPKSVGLWDATKQRSIDPPLHTSDPVKAVDFHRDGKRLAVGTNTGVVLIWDTSIHEGPAATTSLGGHRGAVTSVRFSPSGNLLASGGADHTIRLSSVE